MPLPQRRSKHGPVVDYLLSLIQTGTAHRDPAKGREMTAAAKEAIHAAKTALSTPEGAILLELLEKSTQEFFLPPESDPRALDALNAQRFIALDLRRIERDEFDDILAEETHVGRGGRGPGR